MMILTIHRMLILAVLILLTQVHLMQGDDDECNEFVCGSVVSKCLLTQSCQCKITDCFCCKDCLSCLGDLFTECCSCLDMCPKANVTLSGQSERSEIGDIDGLPELFDTLTAEDDEEDEWTTMRFAMRTTTKSRLDSKNSTTSKQNAPTSVNCTIIYLNSCIRSKKCKQQCESMGATSYRWFHDGCCQCVGSNCFKYGINESRCTACPLTEKEAAIANAEELEDDFESELNFDENLDKDDLDDLEDDVEDVEDVDEEILDYGEDETSLN